jgi:MFS family permease
MFQKVTRPRDVRVIALARLISEAGDEIALIALLFQAKSSGPAAISAIFALYALSRILLAPYSGSIVDRFPIKRLIITVSLAQTAVAICLAFSNGALLYALIFLLAIGATIIGPAWQVIIPTLVASEELSRTYAFIQAHRSFSIIIGSSLGGFLVQKFDSSTALLIDAASFLAVGMFALTLQNDRKPGLVKLSQTDSVQGFKQLISNPVLIASIVLLVAFNMSAGVNEVLGIFLVTDILHGSASQYGLVMSSLGISMFATGFVLSRVSINAQDTTCLIISAATSALGMFIYGISPNVYVAMLAFAICGIGLSGLHAFGTPIIVRHTQEEERGRVFAATSSITTGGTLLSTGIGGFLGSIIPIRIAISGAAIICGFSAMIAGSRIIRAEKGLAASAGSNLQ